ENISDKLQKKNKRKRRLIISAAASVVMALGVCMWLVYPSKPKDTGSETAVDNEPNFNINNTEVYYSALIGEKRNELNQYCKNQPDLCKEFDKDFEELNIMYGHLKTEYSQSPDKEVVLKAMIENLKTQVEILSRQLQVLENIKQKEKKLKNKNV
ncbi:MAG TPA: hypothetical protein VEC12_12765, partial [Bacteroidia bacterium]|nr:hypothetical protein [Bacteroidia bacterium]